MTMPPPMPDRQYTGQYPKKGMSTGSKVLIGCGIGCGTVILLIIIAGVIGAWWFFSSEDQVPTDKILNTGTSAAFRLEDISRDRECMQLVSDLIKEAQRIEHEQSDEQLPEFLKNLRRFSESQQDPTQFLQWLSPKEATASISSDTAENPVFVIAANFGTGTRMVKMLLNSVFEGEEHLRDKKISTEYGDLYIFEKRNDWNTSRPEQDILGFYKGTLIFSNDQEYAVSAMDRLADESNIGKLNYTLAEPFDRLSHKESLAYGVLDGSFFKAFGNGMGMFEGELGSEIKKAEISLDKLSGEKGILNLRLDWNDKEFAAMANEKIEKIKTEWINSAYQNGFDLEIMNSLDNEQLDIKFQVNNLLESLVYLMQTVETTE